jgi:hypothetical protein
LFGSFIYQINIKLPFLFFVAFAILTYLFFLANNSKRENTLS